MKSTFLILGGIIQILIVALHISIFIGIASYADMPANFKATAHIFNAAVTITVIFFAYVSLLCRKDILGTKLGHIICIFIAVFYLQRGFVEFFIRGFSPVNLGVCVAIAAIYMFTALPSKK